VTETLGVLVSFHSKLNFNKILGAPWPGFEDVFMGTLMGVGLSCFIVVI
jgi:hypothetical protein